jgi:tripartite ATP-independent transporter DctM subunit
MEWLALVMLATMIVGIFVGVPVSFTLLFLAIVFGSIGLGPLPAFNLAYYNLLGGLSDQILMSIPMFIFMGYLCERAGLIEGLFTSLKRLLQHIPGSLYYVVILISVLVSLATGVVGAAVTLLGIMAAPSMMRLGYDPKLSAGVIAGGGSLIMIPPAIPLIVMAPTMNVSIIDLYAASLIPGIMIAGMYILYCAYNVWRTPSMAPVVAEEPIDLRLLGRVLLDIIPLAVLISAVLGSMLFGLATSTEAGSFGAFGALTLAVLYGKMNLSRVQEALLKTVDVSAVVMLLAIASMIFGAVFTGLGGDKIIVSAITETGIPGWAIVGTILVLCHLLGWPFEWPVVVLVFLPIFMPILIQNGVDLIWFGAALGIVLQTSYLTPPVALTSYYLKKVVPQWELKMIFQAMFPFMWIQVVAVVILFLIPAIATWLPATLTAAKTNDISINTGQINFGPRFEYIKPQLN